MESPQFDKYQIGIICALKKELKAMRAIFDEEHEPLKIKDAQDRNSYVLGRIGEHNVVAAGLPAGVYGTTSAALVGKDMLRTFRQLRFGLLVGIGGGIPNIQAKRDIRLGDVVVGQPDATYGGVIQYDFGNDLGEGKFRPKGFLNKPPQALLTALTNLGSSLDDIPMSRHLEEIYQKHPDFKQEGYCYQGAEQDCLQCKACDPSQWSGPLSQCKNCDGGKVKRPRRTCTTPVIHYGTIASANTLLKDAVKRDWLGTEYGALCVEMEAAGLDDYPCLVIRGICDYADAYKNDAWQEYAALTAAVFAKVLLGYVSPYAVKQENLLSSQVYGLLDQQFQRQEIHYQQQETFNQRQDSRYQNDQQRDCHRVFKTSNYEQQKNLNDNAVPGTCNWVRDHLNYREWLSSTKSGLLWISADPGCGKSVLSKTLIDDWLPSAMLADTVDPSIRKPTVCYFFFKDNEEQRNLATALCAILHQLFNDQPSLLKCAQKAFDNSGNKLQQEVFELWRILQLAAEDVSVEPIICVLDALDECRDVDRRCLIDLLCQFYQDSTTKFEQQNCFKWLVTSRPYDDIQDGFNDIPSHMPSIRLRGEDQNDQIRKEIDLVIDKRMDKLKYKLRLSEAKTQEFVQQLKQMENRTYLWLHLVIDDIETSLRKTLYKNKAKLTALPATVDAAYEKILGRIIDEEEQQLAKTILTIIVGARRPLTVGEMALALDVAVLPKPPESLAEFEIDANDLDNSIRRWCGLFVFINGGRLYLIHQTAKEFLLGHNKGLAPQSSCWKHCLCAFDVEKQMAKICVIFLCLSDYNMASQGVGRVRSDSDSGDSNDSTSGVESFFIFASEHWADHVRTVEEDLNDEIQSSIRGLYDLKSERSRRWTAMTWKIKLWRSDLTKIDDIHLASFNGHNLVLQHVLNANPDKINQADSYGRSSLFWAANAEHPKTVELLLAQLNIDVNLGAPLSMAASEGKQQIVELLLAHPNIDVNLKYPLYRAVSRGYIGIVDHLLAHLNLDVNFGEPLRRAANAGHKEILKRLLAHPDVDVNLGEPLYAASFYGHTKATKLLLAHPDIDVNSREPLYWAAAIGHKEIVKLFLAHPDVDVNRGYDYDSITISPLCVAAYMGQKDIVELLLAHPNTDLYFANSLQWTTYLKHEGIMELLQAHPGFVEQDIMPSDDKENQVDNSRQRNRVQASDYIVRSRPIIQHIKRKWRVIARGSRDDVSLDRH